MRLKLSARCWNAAIFPLSISIAASLFCGQQKVFAQAVAPDNTLGPESSVVVPNVEIRGVDSDRIDGGAQRGANLFHSFQEFNIETGRGAFFSNPAGIDNILTRVTGANISNINGVLGVLGEANLFLINPNGILFGANARLDISGSFAASTADAFSLGEEGIFSATAPEQSQLLAFAPNISPFLNALTQNGTIAAEGILEVGGDLFLEAAQIQVDQSLQAGGQLTLAGRDAVQLGDNVTELASTGEISIQSQGEISIADLANDVLEFSAEEGAVSLIADVDSDGVGSVVMAEPIADILAINGQDISISGALLVLGNIQTAIVINLPESDIQISEGTAFDAEVFGGNITLKAEGDISIGNLDTSVQVIFSEISRGNDISDVEISIKGGDISLDAGGNLETGDLHAFSKVDATIDSSTVNLPSSFPTIPGIDFTNEGIFRGPLDGSGDIGSISISTRGGEIFLSAGRKIETGEIHTFAASRVEINNFIGFDSIPMLVLEEGDVGDVGDIEILDIGGKVELNTISGSIVTGSIFSSALAASYINIDDSSRSFQGGGNIGDIALLATGGEVLLHSSMNIIADNIDSEAIAAAAVFAPAAISRGSMEIQETGGKITLEAPGEISTGTRDILALALLR